MTRADEVAISQGMWIDEEKASHAKRWCEKYIRQPDKPRQALPIIPWVWEDLIRPMYGWRQSNNTSRFKHGSVFVMKKQTKSSTIAGCALYDLVSTSGAEVYIWSTNMESSSAIWKVLDYSTDINPHLATAIHKNGHLKTLRYKKGAGFLKVLSGNSAGKRGQNSSSVYVDELSEIRDHQLDAWEGLYNSGAARWDEWKMISLSTPQYNRRSLCWREWCKNQAILKSEDEDTSYLAVCHAVPVEYADEPDKWWDYIPSLGITTSKDFYLSQYQTVKNSPRDLAVFRCECLTQWVDVMDQWIPDSTISQSKICIDEKLLYGKDAWLGVDAALYSLSAYVLLVEHEGKLVVIPRFQMPIETAQASDEKYGTSWMAWGKSGFLTLTEGNQFDPATIRKQIVEDSQRFRIRDAASDGYNFAESASILMQNHGIEVLDVPPSVRSLSEATVEYERRLSKGELVYLDSPVYAANLRACQVKQYQDGIIIDREKSSGRYDGVSASIVALNRYLAKPKYKYTGLSTLNT